MNLISTFTSCDKQEFNQLSCRNSWC